MPKPGRIALPGAMAQTTGHGHTRSPIYAYVADWATLLILLPGWDQAILVDKERAFSALSTRRQKPRFSYRGPLVLAAEVVHSHGQVASW
jgi:hypothetical protein